MHVALMAAVVAAVAIAENGPAGPVAHGALRHALAMCPMAAAPLFAAAISLGACRAVRQDTQRAASRLQWFGCLRRVHTALWLATGVGVAYWLDWANLVRFNWRLGNVILLDDLLILVPALLPLVLSWAAFYEVDRARQRPDGESAAAYPSRVRYLSLHARHYLGLMLAPVLVVLAANDLARWVAPDAGQAELACWVFVPLLVLTLVLFPLLLRAVWHTRPLPEGRLRDRLVKIARKGGVGFRDILVWKTDRFVTNAAVAGLVAPLRYVFISDGLIDRLSDDQIEAVFAHEIGHLRHRHLWLRLAAVAAPLAAWFAVQNAFPAMGDVIAYPLIAVGIPPTIASSVLLLCGMALAIGVVLARYSRLQEHQADLWAAGALRDEDPNGRPESPGVTQMVAALEKLAQIVPGSDRRNGWFHPSIARRVELLCGMGDRPAARARYAMRLRLVTCGLLGVVIAALVAPLLGL